MKLEARMLLLAFAAAAGANVRGRADAHLSKAEPANATAAKKKPKVHLDVGFTDFQKNLTAQVADQVKKATAEAHWSTAEGEVLAANVTKALAEGMNAALKPLKMSIGKTWMALPQDEQKETYVSQLKAAFVPVFASSTRTAESHLRLSLHRVEGEHNVAVCGKALIDGLLAEHCYDAALTSKVNSTSKSSSNVSNKKRFCIQSVVDGLAHRLNDTQGLLSMSMRFEAGAMSLAQRAKAAAKKH
jgi:hypothetical protein